MLEWQLPHLVVRPQFAYVPNRGTMDALLRIHKHLDDAAQLIRSNRIDRFGRHSGRKPLPFTGALSLSLDLSRAFDLTDRPSLFRALQDYQVPQAVVEVAQRLHFGARFVYKAGDYQAHFTPTNGLKQGCRLAPCLWVWWTLALMDTLESRLPQGWVDDVLTLFADDCWCSWLLRSLSDLRKALSKLTILLCTLEDYKMQINYSKTAVLLKFVGKQAKQALHEITVMKNGVRHLSLMVHDVERLIPIQDSHEYLGTKVTYDGPREANLTHRLQCGQRKFQMIQKALTGHHAITQEHRTRLWSACVRTSLHYSLPAVGLTEPDLRRLETRTLKHLRAILRLPVHKTHVSNTEIWQRSQVEPPGPQILQALISFRSKLEARLTTHPDITTRPGIMAYVRSLERQLTAVLEQRASQQDILTSQHALRIHYGLHHPEHQLGTIGQGQTFDPRQHAVGGLPHADGSSRSGRTCAIMWSQGLAMPWGVSVSFKTLALRLTSEPSRRHRTSRPLQLHSGPRLSCKMRP